MSIIFNFLKKIFCVCPITVMIKIEVIFLLPEEYNYYYNKYIFTSDMQLNRGSYMSVHDLFNYIKQIYSFKMTSLIYLIHLEHEIKITYIT